MQQLPRLAGLLALCLLAALPARAATDPAALCDDAARVAAAHSTVPLDILLAITRAETGRRVNGTFKPWPWAINDGGKGYWLATEDEAKATALARLTAGDDNFDIGCFQINAHWHGANFASYDDMFDPVRNATYAADFLTRLYEQTGDWTLAIGAYHSLTPDLAAPYASRVNELRGLPPLPQAEAVRVTEAAVRVHENLYPLLKAGDAGAIGSLVPLQSGARPIIDDRG